MRIEKDFITPLNNRKKITSGKGVNPEEVSFKDKLAELDQQEVKDRLDKLLDIVDEHGEKLKRSLDKKDMMEYKKRVKDFLKLIQEEFAQTKQSFSWDGRGNLKTYTIIEKVDKNLEALHDLFLEEQADVLEVLSKIDEIRGLLLDLYI